MKKGFILLEVLIAISIVGAVMGGAFVLVWQTTSATNAAASRLTASYLCQEGLELIRHKRDSNWLAVRIAPGLAWDNGLPSGIWEIGYDDAVLSPYGQGRFLRMSKFYNYNDGVSVSPFKRKVTIEKISPEGLRVAVEVFWQERGKSHSVMVAEELYNSLRL